MMFCMTVDCSHIIGFTESHLQESSERGKGEISMLEKMGEFFDNRIGGYEEHQLTCIDSAQEFYPFTASLLPKKPGASVLDLGCGTGLELNYYFQENPSPKVTGIDLAPGMLKALREKFSDKDLTLIQGSYFEVPFGKEVFEALAMSRYEC